jgi:hypothetical protein
VRKIEVAAFIAAAAAGAMGNLCRLVKMRDTERSETITREFGYEIYSPLLSVIS